MIPRKMIPRKQETQKRHFPSSNSILSRSERSFHFWFHLRVKNSFLKVVALEALKMPLEASEVPLEASEMPFEASDLPLEASEMPLEALETPIEALETPIEAL